MTSANFCGGCLSGVRLFVKALDPPSGGGLL